MAFTYSGNPAASNRDAVRFRVGDTKANATITLADAEIDAELTATASNVAKTAVRCARRLMGQAMRAVNAPLGEGRDEIRRQYQALIEELENEERQSMTITPFGGGTVQSDKDALSDSDTLVQPDFYKEKDDYVTPAGPRSLDDDP